MLLTKLAALTVLALQVLLVADLAVHRASEAFQALAVYMQSVVSDKVKLLLTERLHVDRDCHYSERRVGAKSITFS